MKNIIITGASKGIGRAIALHFAKNGYAIAACARTEKDVKALEAEVKALAPDMPHVLRTCDMSDRAQVVAFAQQVKTAWDHVHILVNNAGTFLPGQVINEADGTLEKLIDTNLYSAYHMTRQFVQDMIRDRRGHIFNMCSVASIGAYHNGGSYSISKFALLGLSKALREELKPHAVKVTSLIPGATYTDSWSGAGIEEDRFMKAEDIAQTVWDIYHLSRNTVVEEVVLRPMLGDL
ncbi:MAG: short-chain dehydrogenase/reductase [Bacteroidetes bacterium]|nr:short-chain dehydrogenase/reductase [Bacteroidota bacterium]